MAVNVTNATGLEDESDADATGEGDVGDAGQTITLHLRSSPSTAAALSLYEELSAAADAADARLEPFFERREVVNGLLSAGPASEQVVVFPVVSLTVRRDGDLTGLYPCWQDGTHYSVEDALDALADGSAVENL